MIQCCVVAQARAFFVNKKLFKIDKNMFLIPNQMESLQGFSNGRPWSDKSLFSHYKAIGYPLRVTRLKIIREGRIALEQT